MKIKKSITLDKELKEKIEGRVENGMASSFSEVVEFLIRMGFVALESIEEDDKGI